MLLDPRISASMVLYHSGASALDAAKAVAAATVPIDLHIVDNSPEDGVSAGIRAVAPKCSIHRMRKNLGYGAANNVAMRKINSTYHIIMNPDVTFAPDLPERMAAFLDAHPDVVMLTPRLVGDDGEEQFVPRMQPTVRRMLARPLAKHFAFARKWRDAYTLRGCELEGPLSVEFASGCFIFIRTHTFFRLEGFDERFFLYHEDSDLSRRALKFGSIVYHPDFTVTHHWKRESAHSGRARRMHIRSTLRYFKKWGWSW